MTQQYDGTFYVTISKNSNDADFSLVTNPLYTEDVSLTPIGYQEQLYKPAAAGALHG